MAKGKWAAFPHASKAFEYPGEKLHKAWAKLHAGDQEPYPDATRIAALLKGNPKLGKAADAAKIATRLEEAWRHYHAGDFQAADEIGESLGPLGAVVANKAMGIHAAYLVDDEKEKMKRFQHVAARAESAIAALPKEANAHYFRAFAIGRYSQLLSITKALSAAAIASSSLPASNSASASAASTTGSSGCSAATRRSGRRAPRRTRSARA